MVTEQPWTIGRLLQWTTDYFKDHGAQSPRLDAEVLLADARGCERIDLYTAFDQLASEETRDRFRAMVRRRAAGEPVAYLVGRREFFSLPFVVTTDVLIPRPETELLVTAALDAIKLLSPDQEPVDVADVGTGSGAVAVSIARHAAQARLTATDISAAALAVAHQNATQLGVADRVVLLESDLLTEVPEAQHFGVITSNPPYVGQRELADLPIEVKQYEPHQALVAGPTGGELIQRLVPQAAQRLQSGGVLLVEISPMIEQEVLDVFGREQRLGSATVIKDLAGLPRVISAQRNE